MLVLLFLSSSFSLSLSLPSRCLHAAPPSLSPSPPPPPPPSPEPPPPPPLHAPRAAPVASSAHILPRRRLISTSPHPRPPPPPPSPLPPQRHLSIRASTAPPQLLLHPDQHGEDQQLLHQLVTIRASVSHLNHLRSSSPPPPPPPPELLLYSRLAPVASACSAHPDLLHRFMSYAPFAPCPDDALSVAEPLILRGCHPLPRRRCFSPTPPAAALRLPADPFSPLPDSAARWPADSKCRSFSCLPPSLGFDVARTEAGRFLHAKGPLDLTVPQLLRLASLSRAGPIRLGLDVGGGTGTLAARLKRAANATVVTTTMNLGAPYSEAAAARGVVAVHAPLQQRLPVGDGTMDVVRAGHAVNRWIPEAALEFLWYDADRALRPGGLLWVDHFWCRRGDLDGVYAPMLRRLAYKTIKWAVADKQQLKDEVYLTALLQKPPFSSSY